MMMLLMACLGMQLERGREVLSISLSVAALCVVVSLGVAIACSRPKRGDRGGYFQGLALWTFLLVVKSEHAVLTPKKVQVRSSSTYAPNCFGTWLRCFVT